MPQTNLTDIEDTIVEIDKTIEEDEAEEMESISNQLYAELEMHPKKFSKWETSFIEDIFYRDKFNLTRKQIEWLYKLDDKYIRNPRD